MLVKLIVPTTFTADRKLGGLIVLLLFLRHWPVARCLKAFDVMTRHVFRQRQERDRSILGSGLQSPSPI